MSREPGARCGRDGRKTTVIRGQTLRGGGEGNRLIRGSILILTLWVVFFLSLLAVAVHTHVASSLSLALYLKNFNRAGWSAASGVDRALAAVSGGSNQWDGLVNDAESFRDLAVGEGRACIYYTYESGVAGGGAGVITNWGIVGEEGKINLNKASQRLLEALLSQPGMAGGASPGEVAACIVDWRDPDDDVLTGGAEGSYYRGLTGSYGCRNGDLQSRYELLLVKGIGGGLFARLAPHVTVYGTGKVNINAADPVVLRAVADATGVGSGELRESLVEKIVRFRESGQAFREGSVPAIIGAIERASPLAAEERAVLMSMLPTMGIRSTFFWGVSEGYSAGYSDGTGVGSGSDHPGAVDLGRRVEFVLNGRMGTIVSWYEY